MRNGKAVAKLEAEIGPMAFLVRGAEVEDPSLLPPGVRIPMRACRGLELKTAIARWLANRQAQETPGSAATARAYRAGAGGLGRMYPAKHAAAALSYYLSGTDRYYLTPEKAEIVYGMPENGRYTRPYLLAPCTEEMAEGIREGKGCMTGKMPRVFPPDIGYTVPSSTTSGWEWKGQWKCLVQRPGEQGLSLYRDVLRERFPSMEDKGVVRIDFSYIKDDVLWLPDLLPCMDPGGDAWGQASKLLRDFPGSGEALEKLEECTAASEEYQSPGGWSRMGVSCGEHRMEPVVIL